MAKSWIVLNGNIETIEKRVIEEKNGYKKIIFKKLKANNWFKIKWK